MSNNSSPAGDSPETHNNAVSSPGTTVDALQRRDQTAPTGGGVPAFHRLQALGEAKFKDIIAELRRGTPPLILANKIQNQWDDLRETDHGNLANELRRLARALQVGLFRELTNSIPRSAVAIEDIDQSTVDVLIHSVELIETLWARLQKRLEQPASTDQGAGVTAEVRALRDLMAMAQKIRYELGLEKRKRSERIALAEEELNQQVVEAYAAVDDILRKYELAEKSAVFKGDSERR